MEDRHIPSFVSELPQTSAALAYAERVHESQRREADGAPFILHPLEVTSLLYYAGAPDHVIAAGALHDVIEDTDADADDLHGRFGPRITALVLAVSDDERIENFSARKAALRNKVASAGPDALLIFAADKISKTRELQLVAGQAPRNLHASVARRRRVRHYARSAELLSELIAESPLVGRLQRELDILALTTGLHREPVSAG